MGPHRADHAAGLGAVVAMDLLIDVELVVRGRSLILKTAVLDWRWLGWRRKSDKLTARWQVWGGPFLLQWW